jgi:hypothetical protein
MPKVADYLPAKYTSWKYRKKIPKTLDFEHIRSIFILDGMLVFALLSSFCGPGDIY